ncbi:MAG: hypothetical protein ACRCZJ_01840 [Erysipelotrichaceae bacterium]
MSIVLVASSLFLDTPQANILQERLFERCVLSDCSCIVVSGQEASAAGLEQLYDFCETQNIACFQESGQFSHLGLQAQLDEVCLQLDGYPDLVAFDQEMVVIQIEPILRHERIFLGMFLPEEAALDALGEALQLELEALLEQAKRSPRVDPKAKKFH